MALANSQGAIRPNHTPFDLHQLNKALISCDAIASLIEGAVRHPESVSIENLVILADCLRDAANTLDPRIARRAGGAA